MTYYYAINQDDYNGIQPRGSAATLQNALKGLRKALKNDGMAPVGYVFDSAKIPEYYPSRTPKNLVGTMYSVMGKKKKGKVYGREITITETDFVWLRKGSRKQYKVLSDGRITPYKRE